MSRFSIVPGLFVGLTCVRQVDTHGAGSRFVRKSMSDRTSEAFSHWTCPDVRRGIECFENSGGGGPHGRFAVNLWALCAATRIVSGIRCTYTSKSCGERANSGYRVSEYPLFSRIHDQSRGPILLTRQMGCSKPQSKIGSARLNRAHLARQRTSAVDCGTCGWSPRTDP